MRKVSLIVFLICTVIILSNCSHKLNCQNGGTQSGSSCICPTGFSGTLCEIDNNYYNPFLGTKNADQAYSFIDNVHNMGMTANTKTGTLLIKKGTGDLDLKIYNISGLGNNAYITCSMDTSGNFMAGQWQSVVGANNVLAQISLFYTSSTQNFLVGYLSIKDNGVQTDYDVTWTKQ
jgi:hypothetical protein